MSLLDNAIKHFSESADHELHKVDVPEWDGAVWFKTVSGMTGMEYQRYFKAVSTSDYEAMVDSLILRARREDGIKMFTQGDKKKLMGGVDHDVITDIFTRMSAVDNADSVEVKKS